MGLIINYRKELFDTCQYLLEKHRHFLVRERKYDFLLRGFVYCTCGMRLVGDYSLIRSSHKKLGYYHCQKRYSPDCKQKYIQSKELERQVGEDIKKLQFSDDFINLVKQKADEFVKNTNKNSQGAVQALINQKTGYEAKRSRLEDLRIDGGIDTEAYNRKHTEVNQLIDNIQVQIDEASQEDKLDVSLIDEVMTITRDIAKTYNIAPDPVKRHYIRFFYDNVVVDNKAIKEAKLTPIFDALLCAKMARLRVSELLG